MLTQNSRKTARLMLLATVLASSILAMGQSDVLSAQAPQATTPSAQAGKPAAAVRRTDLASHISQRALMYYQSVWGVDSLKAKYTESGEIIRFSYRILDPQKAAALNDKKGEPTLIDPKAGVSLVVPEVSNVGKLRQTSTPKEGMTYWMAFSNSGRRVRPGDRVIVQIGQFRADGLIVE